MRDTTWIGEQGPSPWDAAALLGNADGDELLFVHDGAGELYCDFGRLDDRAGDYIRLPRGTMWRRGAASRQRKTPPNEARAMKPASPGSGADG